MAVPSTDAVNILLVDDQPAKLLTYDAILGELGEKLITRQLGERGARGTCSSTRSRSCWSTSACRSSTASSWRR